MSFEFTLEIDGRSIPTTGVCCHIQRDPYPGGLSYRLRARRSALASPLGEIDLSFGIQGFLTDNAESDSAGLFVLNTIDAIEDDGDYTVVSGRCSPCCKTLSCPNCDAQIWVNWMFAYCREFSPASSQCLFTCKQCDAQSNVVVTGSRVQFVRDDGAIISECDQPSLVSTVDSFGLQLRLGALKWTIGGNAPVA
jgi:hypothetical protein